VGSVFAPELPVLPLVLWETPPGLEMILAQEGVPFVRLTDPHPLAFGHGRFVLYDGRRLSPARVRVMLSAAHTAIDIDGLRDGEPIDPFDALIETAGDLATWRIGRYLLTERIARYSRASIRNRLLDRLKKAVARSGGLWARLAPYPHPYRSAFNFRADLDEPYPDDYARFARARRSLDDCSTHFVSTHAYGGNAAVLGDLARLDPQSHSHFHVVYRDAESNRRNVERAHAILTKAGLPPVGFAGPEGRWDPAIDELLEELGYEYSSDFQLGYDDVPFFPWRRDRFSAILQIPIHPICEGLFLDAGARNGRAVGDHLASVIRAKTAAGEPAFVYGHPERRLGRFPEVLHSVAEAVNEVDLLWRVTLTEFARWWRWRSRRSWSVLSRAEGRFEVQFDDWEIGYPLALELARGDHVASLPLTSPRTQVGLSDLVYERRRRSDESCEPTPARPSRSLRSALRRALDYETVTPLDDLPDHTVTARLKKKLRRWRARAGTPKGGVL
jgi:hypothetical protein